MTTTVNEALLFRYFEGQATVFEKQWIEDWVKTPENTEFFYQCLAQWEQQNLQYQTDTTAAYHQHMQRLSQTQPATRTQPMRSKRRWYWAAVASFLLALAIGAGYFFQENIWFKSYTTAFGETLQLTLADGSRVALNANSKLQVPRFGFGKKSRTVRLSGEANFSVIHTVDNQRFVVQTNRQFEVIVLGTAFTVSTRASGPKVILERGKVQLRHWNRQTAEQLTLQPGELATLEKTGKAAIYKTAQPENYAAWKDHRFVFDETPLADLAPLFLENFDLQLEIPDQTLAQLTISGSFTARNAKELLTALTEAADLLYTIKNKTITIYESEE